MISTVVAIIYSLLFLVVLLIVIITGIVWLILKPPAKDICGNILIVAASLFVLIGIAGTPVVNLIRDRHETVIPQSIDPRVDALVTKADAAANALEKAEAAELIKSELPLLKPLTQFLALPTQEQSRDYVAAFFKDLPPVGMHRVQIIERQNIFEHEIGKPFTIDSAEDSLSSPSKRLIELIRSVDEPISADQVAKNVIEIHKRLPAGFYRESLLKATFASAKNEQMLRSLATDHQNLVRARMHKMLLGITLSYLFIFAGVVVLIVFAKSLSTKSSVQAAEPPLQHIPFRRVYCFALLLYFAQFVSAFPVGLVAALDRRIGGVLAHAVIPVTTITFGLNLILVVLCAKWTIFDPMELKTIPTIRKLFSGNVFRAVALGAATCCAVRAIVTIFYWLVYLIFQQSPSTNNAVADQITSLAVSPDSLNLVCLFLTVAIFAPLGEEFAFRGLLYTSIKNKAGTFAAIVFSGAIFATYHLDPGSFVGLLGAGMGLAFLFQRTKSLLPGFFMHCFWNSIVMLLAVLLT